MKFWIICIISLLTFASCQKKDQIITEAEFEEKDTLNLPHYPYIDYDNQFKNTKLNVFDFTEKYNFVKIFFEDYWDYNQVSGGLLVGKNGRIIYENYRGYANFETQDTLTAETPIHIASISKVLTALAIMKLVEADKIKLDQLIANIFPAFPYREITIRDLLNHRSGLPNYAYFEHDSAYWDTNKMQTNEAVLEALIQKIAQPYNLPNSSFAYNNTNYVLLALIIEKITELSYADAMQYIVFDPLRMDKTFVFNIQDSAKVSQSYTYKNKRWEFNYLDQIYGDKNIYSTPQDLFKMDKAMYAKDFLKQEFKDLMKKGYSYEKQGVKNYGLGIRMMEWETGQKLLYHNGWWHGNYSSYVRGEADTLTIIALGNRQVRSVYSAFSLAGVLGDYPIVLEIEEAEPEIDSAQISHDSIVLEMQQIKEKQLEKKLKAKPIPNEKNEIQPKDSAKTVILPKISTSKIDSLKNQLSNSE